MLSGVLVVLVIFIINFIFYFKYCLYMNILIKICLYGFCDKIVFDVCVCLVKVFVIKKLCISCYDRKS